MWATIDTLDTRAISPFGNDAMVPMTVHMEDACPLGGVGVGL